VAQAKCLIQGLYWVPASCVADANSVGLGANSIGLRRYFATVGQQSTSHKDQYAKTSCSKTGSRTSSTDDGGPKRKWRKSVSSLISFGRRAYQFASGAGKWQGTNPIVAKVVAHRGMAISTFMDLLQP
jgi:hypothetical protein